MGSICWISSDPRRWRAYETGQKLKEEYGGEDLFKVCYGSFDDDPGGVFDLEMLMRQSVYQKAMSGEYKVSPNSRWQHKLILVDAVGKEISPVGATIY